MKIKTFSQLTPLSEQDSVHDQSYFAISQYNEAGQDSKYLSRKLAYGQLSRQIRDSVDSELLVSDYCSKVATEEGYRNVNLSAMHRDIGQLSVGDITFSGAKHFKEVPTIDADVDPQSRDTNVPNLKCVREMITSQAGYMTDQSIVDLDPKNSEGYTVYDEGDGDKQMYWHIDHGQRDSSLYVDENGAPAGGLICRHTGNLVCYGWLADNGNVRPENAWVALYGLVLCPIDRDGNLGQKWVALQVQPWIIGKKSSTLQYVGFNIPVKAGLKLKIMTGFTVNGNNSGLSDRPTLMFAEAGTMPNTFVGYILHDSDD